MKSIQGTITSLATPKTAKVSVVRAWQHPLYKKSVKRTKVYHCDTADFKLTVGTVVTIAPCKPVSKTKHFVVVGKVEEQS